MYREEYYSQEGRKQELVSELEYQEADQEKIHNEDFELYNLLLNICNQNINLKEFLGELKMNKDKTK